MRINEKAGEQNKLKSRWETHGHQQLWWEPEVPVVLWLSPLSLPVARIFVLPCPSPCSNLLLTQTRGHVVICQATYCSAGNVRESLFIFVTAASVREKTASKITSVGITYWFVSRFSQSPFYCCSRQGQGRSKITLSNGGNRLRNSNRNSKFSERCGLGKS